MSEPDRTLRTLKFKWLRNTSLRRRVCGEKGNRYGGLRG